MNAKEAIAKAKDWVADIFADEGISDLGLEEVKFDDQSNDWLITLGFSRPWDANADVVAKLARDPLRRTYKVVRVRDQGGEVQSIENRH